MSRKGALFWWLSGLGHEDSMRWTKLGFMYVCLESHCVKYHCVTMGFDF